MNDLIVVINAGSATVKFAGYEVCANGAVVQRVKRGIAEFTSDGARSSVINKHDAAIVNDPIVIRSRQSSAMFRHALSPDLAPRCEDVRIAI